MKKRKLYVLWYQGYSSGWPTANNRALELTDKEFVPQAYVKLADAKNGLMKHNELYPSDKDSMSTKVFVEVEKTKRRK